MARYKRMRLVPFIEDRLPLKEVRTMDIENPMTIDSLWKEKEKEPKVIDECVGCMEDIYEGEDVYEFTSITGQTVMVHQKPGCCQYYVADISNCKVAGE
jgi:hypothetical protein